MAPPVELRINSRVRSSWLHARESTSRKWKVNSRTSVMASLLPSHRLALVSRTECATGDAKSITAILFSLELPSASSETQLTERDGGCTQNTSPEAHNAHIFSCEHHSPSSAHLQVRSHHFLAQGEIESASCSVCFTSISFHDVVCDNVPFVHFLSVLFSPTAQSSRPSASTTSTAYKPKRARSLE